MPETTKERLEWLMNERDLKQVDLLDLVRPYCEKYGVKLEKSHLSNYLSGLAAPRSDKLTMLSLALNVSESWLMGLDVPMARETPAIKLSGRSQEFIRLFSLLTEEEQKLIVDSIKGILSHR